MKLTVINPVPESTPYQCEVPGVLTVGSSVEIRGKLNIGAESFGISLLSASKQNTSPQDTVFGLTVSLQRKIQELSCWSHIDSVGSEIIVYLKEQCFREGVIFIITLVVAEESIQVLLGEQLVANFLHRIDSRSVTHLALDGDAKFDLIQFVCAHFNSPLWQEYLLQQSENTPHKSLVQDQSSVEWDAFMSAGDSVKLDLFSKDSDLSLEEKYQHNSRSCTSEQDSPPGVGTSLLSDSSFDWEEVQSEGKENKRRGLHVRFDMDENSNHSNNVSRDKTRSVKELRLIFDRDAKDIPSPPVMTSPRGTHHSGINLRKYEKPSDRRNYRSDPGEVDYSPQYKGFNSMAGVDLDSDVLSPDMTLDSSTLSIDGSYDTGDGSFGQSSGYGHGDSLVEGGAIGGESDYTEHDEDRNLLDGGTDSVGNGADMNEPSVITEDMFALLSKDLETDDAQQNQESEVVEEVVVESVTKPVHSAIVFPDHMEEGDVKMNADSYRDSGIGLYGDQDGLHDTAEVTPLLRGGGSVDDGHFQQECGDVFSAQTVVMETDKSQLIETFTEQRQEQTFPSSEIKNGNYVALDQPDNDLDKFEQCESPDSALTDDDFKSGSGLVDNEGGIGDDAEYISISEKDYICENRDSLKVITWLKPPPKEGLELPHTLHYPDGFQPGTCIYINGYPKEDAKSFHVTFQTEGDLPHTTVGLQMRPMFLKEDKFNSSSHVLCNSFVQGQWGEELRCCDAKLSLFPFTPGKQFLVRIVIKDECYQVTVDGNYALLFPHRVDPKEITHVRLDGDASFQTLEVTDELELPYFVKIPRGMHIGKTIWIEAEPEPDAKRFHVSFQCPAYSDIAIPFRMKILLGDGEQRVVCSSYCKGAWEEREYSASTTPFETNEKFLMKITAGDDSFKVMVNGLSFAEYPIVLPIHHVTHMEIDGDISLFSVNFHDKRNGKASKGGCCNICEILFCCAV